MSSTSLAWSFSGTQHFTKLLPNTKRIRFAFPFLLLTSILILEKVRNFFNQFFHSEQNCNFTETEQDNMIPWYCYSKEKWNLVILCGFFINVTFNPCFHCVFYFFLVVSKVNIMV